MNQYWILLPIVTPILLGACIPLFHFENAKTRRRYVGGVTVLNTLLMFLVMFLLRPQGELMLLNMAGKLSISFHMDGMGCVFGSLVAVLWPIATFYAFEYMKHEGKENTFFTFYTMTYGITVGIAFAANLMTLYLFYELLTFVTLPLVMHGMSKKSVFAGRRYVTYSVGGAAFAFIGIACILTFGDSIDFVYGGVLNGDYTVIQKQLLRGAYVLTTFGFGVKAAVFPFHRWLPTASVAPTPVTALLHAVAVVKAGAFAILRITYFSFGTELLKGTVVQYIVMAAALVTILFGSTMALKEQHLKRRLAYSTISNLSYIVFGASLMTPEGLTGALTHMVVHGVVKITLFFCAGAVLYKTGKEYVHDMRGMGKRMPITFACFTLASVALSGVPPLPGFLSKWNLAEAALHAGNPLAFMGVVVLLISAVLTAIYLFLVVFKTCFPSKAGVQPETARCEANAYMTVPLILLCALIVLLGIFARPLTELFAEIAKGGIVL
ncbi:MAG: proton-conducting transporter membrane subunit [Lachnospiraceae bacterium]|nr:proton-conducting transporter membrane subunit [Lachnospiraceae bacterium]